MLKQTIISVLAVTLLGGVADASKWTKFRDKVEHTVSTPPTPPPIVKKVEQKLEQGVTQIVKDGAATVAKDVKDGAATVAKDVKDGAATVAKDVKGMEQNVHDKINDVRQDVKDGRYGEAIKDTGRAMNVVVDGAGAPLVEIGTAGEDATREGKAANRAAHEGAFGRAAEHAGNVVTDAGKIIAVADPAAGGVVVAVGHETTAMAQTGEHVNAVAHDLAKGDPKQAVQDALPNIKDDVASAATDLREGKFGAAAEHVGQAVNVVSPGNGDQIVSTAQAGKAATASGHEATADVRAGKLGDAGIKAGNAVSRVGDAVKTVDSGKGDAIKSAGNTISDTAAKAETVAKMVRGN